jgi:hypothetical protein
MSVTVKLHLPVPEGKPGDEVELSQERAAALVDRRYATYVSGGSTAPEPVTEPDVYEPVESASAPVTDLPAVSDKKAEWVAAADALGLDTEGLTKDEVIEVVLDAT